jgi:DNA-binding ferritin-like protein (Dps family)
MANVLEKIVGSLDEKREWRTIKKRAKALPAEYQIAYQEILQYAWKSSGLTTIKPFSYIIDIFEEGAAADRKVLDITGNDVASFVDELIRDEKTYTNKYRKNLNQNIAKKLKEKLNNES